MAGIIIYVLIGVLALRGGLAVLRTEAILLTILIFLGFNVAWLLLFDDRPRLMGARQPRLRKRIRFRSAARGRIPGGGRSGRSGGLPQEY